MPKTTAQPVEDITWEALRHKSTLLGIPAWKLAESFAVHERNGELVFRIVLDDSKT